MALDAAKTQGGRAAGVGDRRAGDLGSMEAVSMAGKSGQKVIFSAAGRIYETSAVSSPGELTTKSIQALVASGQATPQFKTYEDQFPWTKPQPAK